MMNRKLFCQTLLGGAAGLVAGSASVRAAVRPPDVVKHLEIYREKGQFAGWPANHGSWQWGNELLFGFEVGAFKETARGHAIDYSKPAEHVLARSLDAGETWTIERPASLQPPPGAKVAGVPTGTGGKEVTDCPGDIDFHHKDFAFTARMQDIHVGPSRFYYSYDRGKSWEGPFRLPDKPFGGMAARTDYHVLGKHDMLMLVTVPKSDGREGRPAVLRTRDGGKSWETWGMIGPEPPPGEFAIMPKSIMLSGTTMLCAIRHRQNIEIFRSINMGQNWDSMGNAVERIGGNPPSLVRLRDGRLVLVYGYREKPQGIRARISRDLGKTWGDELRIRTDGAAWDLGYVRSFPRADGNIVSVYYYTDGKSPERYIGGTIWYPGDLDFTMVDPRFAKPEKP